LAPAEPAPKTEFTRVTEAELRRRDQDDDEGGLRQWLVVGGVLAAAVLALGGGVFFGTRPASADRLYQRVKSAAEEGGAERLVNVESDLTRFVEAYPDDPRLAEMQGFQQDLQLYRLQKRFELRARRVGGVEGLSPLERAYLAAIQTGSRDPGLSLTQLEALVSVFGGPAEPGLSPVERQTHEQCLALARQQIDRLRPTVQKINAQERAALGRQLERADTLAATDRPAAEKIWQGIVTLYAGKNWAKDLVEQAETKLQNK
jgi:hypothetical protein